MSVTVSQVKRAFKYRFHPTDAQADELLRTFGCVRKVYNLAFAARAEAWARQERVNYNATSAMLTGWKKTEELSYLSEVSSVPLQQGLRHLQSAFAGFFAKRGKYPRFKLRKKSRKSAEYTSSAFRYRDGALTLAKMADPLAVVWSRPLPEGATPSTVTVSQDAAGRWFVSMLCDDIPAPMPVTTQAVGIDAGITSLVTLSTGEKITNRKFERKDRARLAKAQRELSRKATRLVRENQTIVIEDLTVCNMVKNHTLARAISDAAWTTMRHMVEYKTARYGRNLVAIDRWFPSSKLCSACGTIAGKMPLHVREWTCGCGVTHDRDVNAARNILAAGLAVSVCGAGVRPQRSIPGGQSATKQKLSRREP